MGTEFPKNDSRFPDFEKNIMGRIREKHIKIKKPWCFAVEKAGLESALMLLLLMSVLVAAAVLYFLTESGIIRFAGLGMAGIEVILMSLPYFHILLFILILSSAVYFANRLEVFCGHPARRDGFAVFFFAVSVAAGLILANYAAKFFRDFPRNSLPNKIALEGKVTGVYGSRIEVEEDGRNTAVIPESGLSPDQKKEYVPGVSIRAVGQRDIHNPNLFYATGIGCCED